MKKGMIVAIVVLLCIFLPPILLGDITALLGPKGLLPHLLAGLWFMNSLFFIMFAWHGMWGNQVAKEWAIAIFILGCVLVLGAYQTSNMGYGYMSCPTIQCETNGKYSEISATRDQIGKPAKCSKCGAQRIVTEDWWN
jgi:hypothetical protein